MFHLPAQVFCLLDAVGPGAPRLVTVAAPVLLLVVGAAVEGRVAAGAPRRRLDAADGTLASKWYQIVVHFVTRYTGSGFMAVVIAFTIVKSTILL